MLTSDQKIKINEKVQGFKEAADFYRMEYSQDLMGMFRDFGCMLLEACGINAEGDPEIKQLFGYRQVLRGTVKRQLTVIAEELAGLWKAPVSGEMFQTALSGMFNFCLYSKGGKNRYLLPVEIAEPLLGLVTCPEGMLSPGEGETVLDTQCGAGSTLMTACKYLKNPKLMGYELDEELWAAGIIISRLSDLKMELHLQEEIPACLYETCDLVISNPVYGTDTIKDDSLAEELPSELRTVRGRYHMELIRGMLALKYDGRAMLIVPNSFLFATRTESIKVRKWLLQSYSLEAVIALPEDTFLDHCIDQYYETLHLKPSIIVRTNQLATIQQLVATNTTAAFLLDHVLEESSDIVKRTVPGLLPAEIDLIWKSSRHLSPHLKNLITAARNI